MLGVIRGPQLVESPSVRFEMGSGHGDCDSGLSGLRVSAADKAHRGTPYEVTDTLGNVVLSGAIVNEAMDEKEYVSECLSPGHYNFVLPEPPEGEYSFSIQGVDLTDQLINDMKRASIPGIALSRLSVVVFAGSTFWNHWATSQRRSML